MSHFLLAERRGEPVRTVGRRDRIATMNRRTRRGAHGDRSIRLGRGPGSGSGRSGRTSRGSTSTSPRTSIYRDGVPHELFRTLRDEHPVWRHPTVPTINRSPDGMGFWVVLGHPEIHAVSRDWRTYSSLEGLAPTPTGARATRGHTILTSRSAQRTRACAS